MPRVRQKKLAAIGSGILILAMMFWPFLLLVTDVVLRPDR
jgi:hypothetical protein